MSTTTEAITQALEHGELQAFGLAMPRLAPDWSPQGAASPSFTAVDATMTITSTANWAAPMDMAFLVVNPSGSVPMPVTLIRCDNSVENGPGILLTLFDQQWLRLGRLYTSVLETTATTRPEFARGLPFRPVPKYIFFPNQTNTIGAGLAEAWADLGFHGDARFYDADGLPIDPVAVMAVFAAILTAFPVLQAVDLSASPVSPLPFTNYLTSLAPTSKTRILLSSPDGTGYDGTHLTGLTAIAASSGLQELTTTGGTIGLDAVSATFTQTDHDRLLFGPATSGRLTSSFTPPTLKSGVTLKRDFFSLRVVKLDPYLIGTWPDNTADPATTIQRRPSVRINENITLLSDGNDVLGAINTALASSPNPSLAVAQAIDGNFTIPASVGTAAHWPQFPTGVPADAGATLAPSLKTSLVFTSKWASTTASDLKKADVVLQITGLPANAWVRVYPRKFLPDAALARGDGQGRLVPASGPVTIYLTDPFSLHNAQAPAASDIIVPANATLMFDIIVVLANGASRIYGGNTAHVDAGPAAADTFNPGTNACGTATYRGISSAGVLGLGSPLTSPAPTTALGWVEALTGETQPRNASRFPTMARRELLVAGSASGTWTGVIGGGRIAQETVCASARIGEPGGLGGRETSVTGATTHGGLLAYDIARHAFRRSKDVISRIIALADSSWNLPAEPTAVAVGGTPSATNGTMAGAVLQTIAPYCETPELYAAWAAGINVNTAIDYVVNTFVPSSIPLHTQVVNALNGLKTTPAAPAPATETSAEQRMAVELEREVTSAYFGRREAQWALQSAIKSARHMIYIETPGFCSTAAFSAPDTAIKGYAADLIAALKAQMTSHPGLKVILCVPKNPDFAPGYEGMASYEIQDRLVIANGRTTAPIVTPLPQKQAILFHPIGFPGRFSRVETNVVIVDDVWAMVGGATIRRRGLTMDGSSDLVFTDTLLENGRSAAIRDFRRGLLAGRLGIAADSTQATYVALNEPATAFRVVSDAAAGSGLGDITSLWDGTTPGLTPATPLPAEQANPDGRDLDVATLTLISVLGAASGV
jgi:hypothetical protein